MIDIFERVSMATILVTGANRGIGFALVERYVGRGDDVIATAREPAAADGLKKLAERSGKLTVLAADVADEASLAAAATNLGSQPIDILICNAGVMSSRGGATDMDHNAGEWSRVLMTNVAGVFLTVQAFLPHLKRSKAGKLALISSRMGSSALPGGSAYAYRASKAAASNLGANFAVELKSSGIAVGIYHPGWVATDLGGGSAPVRPDASAKGLVQRIDQLTLASTGVFEDFEGQPLPF